MATIEEIKNLPDGAHLKGSGPNWGKLLSTHTYYGIYHRKTTEQAHLTMHGRSLKQFERVFAYWGNTIEDAIKRREKFKSCVCYSGDPCPFVWGQHLTYIPHIRIEILSLAPAAISNPSDPPDEDECVCPMFHGGAINHTADCKYILSKQA